MREPTPPDMPGFWWDKETPYVAHAIGRYRILPDGTRIVQVSEDVRVKIWGHDPGDALFAGIRGEAWLESTDGDMTTYVMVVHDMISDVEIELDRTRVRHLEEAHAAMIDVALDWRRRKKTKYLWQPVEQAAAVIDMALHGHCEISARCREERRLAQELRAGTVDLRTLPAVLKSYRDDPLSLRP